MLKRRDWWHTAAAFVVLLLASLFILWPLFKPGFFVSDDGEWMVIRLSAFYQSFRDGQFPVRFLGRLNHEYGYPVANFLYPGFLYIGSLVHLVGFSFVDSVKLIIILSVAGSVVFTFFWLRRNFNIFASVVGSLGLLFAPYVTYDIYQRGSVGEVLSFFPVAVALYSIDAFVPWLFSFAIAFLITSHNSLALLSIFFLGCYLVIRKRNDYWLPFFLGVGMAAFFWFPALLERNFVTFDLQTIANPFAHFISLDRLPLLNIVPILAVAILFTKRGQWFSSAGIFLLVVFIFSVGMATGISSPIWNMPAVAKFFQFPYRFLSLGLFSGAWLVAYAIDRVPKIHCVLIAAIFFVVWWLPVDALMRQITWVLRPDGYYTTNEATTTVGDEYMPRWVREKPKERPIKKLEFFEGRGTITLQSSSTRKVEATVIAKERSVVRLNTIFYPGWGVELDNSPTAISYRNPRGIMHIAVPAGEHHMIAEFRETLPRFFADTISVVSGVIAVVFAAVYIKKSKLAGTS